MFFSIYAAASACSAVEQQSFETVEQSVERKAVKLMQSSSTALQVSHIYLCHVETDGWGDLYHALDIRDALLKGLHPALFNNISFVFRYSAKQETDLLNILTIRLGDNFRNLVVLSRIGEKGDTITHSTREADQLILQRCHITKPSQVVVHQVSARERPDNEVLPGLGITVTHLEQGAGGRFALTKFLNPLSSKPNPFSCDMGFYNEHPHSPLSAPNEGIFIPEIPKKSSQEAWSQISPKWRRLIFGAEQVDLTQIALITGITSRSFEEEFLEKLKRIRQSPAFEGKKVIIFLKDPNCQQDEMVEEDLGIDLRIVKVKHFIPTEVLEALEQLSVALITSGDKSFERAYALGKYILPDYHVQAHGESRKTRVSMFPVKELERASDALFGISSTLGINDWLRDAIHNFQRRGGSLSEEQMQIIVNVIIDDLGKIIPLTEQHLKFWVEVVCPFVMRSYNYGVKLPLFHLRADLLLKYWLSKDECFLNWFKQITQKEAYGNVNRLASHSSMPSCFRKLPPY